MLFQLFAGIVFMFAFMAGVKAGVVGASIGVTVGVTTAWIFFHSLRIVSVRALRRMELWPPEMVDPSREESLGSDVAGCLLLFISLAWFIACSAFANWLTNLLIGWWQKWQGQ